MTSKAFKDFVSKVAADDSMKQELKALTDDDGKVGMDEVVGLAAQHGYEFSVEDISSELDDDQLDKVGGGAAFLKLDGIKLTTEFIKIDLNANTLFFKLP
jgi:predicted ribosomally synthesized peptide with nif11-like leader